MNKFMAAMRISCLLLLAGSFQVFGIVQEQRAPTLPESLVDPHHDSRTLIKISKRGEEEYFQAPQKEVGELLKESRPTGTSSSVEPLFLDQTLKFLEFQPIYRPDNSYPVRGGSRQKLRRPSAVQRPHGPRWRPGARPALYAEPADGSGSDKISLTIQSAKKPLGSDPVAQTSTNHFDPQLVKLWVAGTVTLMLVGVMLVRRYFKKLLLRVDRQDSQMESVHVLPVGYMPLEDESTEATVANLLSSGKLPSNPSSRALPGYLPPRVSLSGSFTGVTATLPSQSTPAGLAGSSRRSKRNKYKWKYFRPAKPDVASSSHFTSLVSGADGKRKSVIVRAFAHEDQPLSAIPEGRAVNMDDGPGQIEIPPQRLPGPWVLPGFGSVDYLAKKSLGRKLPEILKEYQAKYGSIFQIVVDANPSSQQVWVVGDDMQRKVFQMIGTTSFDSMDDDDWNCTPVQASFYNYRQNLYPSAAVLETYADKALVGVLNGLEANPVKWPYEESRDSILQLVLDCFLQGKAQTILGCNKSLIEAISQYWRTETGIGMAIEDPERLQVGGVIDQMIKSYGSRIIHNTLRKALLRTHQNPHEVMPPMTRSVMYAADIFPLMLQWTVMRISLEPNLQHRILKEAIDRHQTDSGKSGFYTHGPLLRSTLLQCLKECPYSVSLGTPDIAPSDLQLDVPNPADESGQQKTPVAIPKGSVIFAAHPGIANAPVSPILNSLNVKPSNGAPSEWHPYGYFAGNVEATEEFYTNLLCTVLTEVLKRYEVSAPNNEMSFKYAVDGKLLRPAKEPQIFFRRRIYTMDLLVGKPYYNPFEDPTLSTDQVDDTVESANSSAGLSDSELFADSVESAVTSVDQVVDDVIVDDLNKTDVPASSPTTAAKEDVKGVTSPESTPDTSSVGPTDEQPTGLENEGQTGQSSSQEDSSRSTDTSASHGNGQGLIAHGRLNRARNEKMKFNGVVAVDQDGGVFKVETANGEYQVTLFNDGTSGRCTCADHYYRKVTCKHQFFVMENVLGVHPVDYQKGNLDIKNLMVASNASLLASASPTGNVQLPVYRPKTRNIDIRHFDVTSLKFFDPKPPSKFNRNRKVPLGMSNWTDLQPVDIVLELNGGGVFTKNYMQSLNSGIDMITFTLNTRSEIIKLELLATFLRLAALHHAESWFPKRGGRSSSNMTPIISKKLDKDKTLAAMQCIALRDLSDGIPPLMITDSKSKERVDINDLEGRSWSKIRVHLEGVYISEDENVFWLAQRLVSVEVGPHWMAGARELVQSAASWQKTLLGRSKGNTAGDADAGADQLSGERAGDKAKAQTSSNEDGIYPGVLKTAELLQTTPRADEELIKHPAQSFSLDVHAFLKDPLLTKMDAVPSMVRARAGLQSGVDLHDAEGPVGIVFQNGHIPPFALGYCVEAGVIQELYFHIDVRTHSNLARLQRKLQDYVFKHQHLLFPSRSLTKDQAARLVQPISGPPSIITGNDSYGELTNSDPLVKVYIRRGGGEQPVTVKDTSGLRVSIGDLGSRFVRYRSMACQVHHILVDDDNSVRLVLEAVNIIVEPGFGTLGDVLACQKKEQQQEVAPEDKPEEVGETVVMATAEDLEQVRRELPDLGSPPRLSKRAFSYPLQRVKEIPPFSKRSSHLVAQKIVDSEDGGGVLASAPSASGAAAVPMREAGPVSPKAPATATSTADPVVEATLVLDNFALRGRSRETMSDVEEKLVQQEIKDEYKRLPRLMEEHEARIKEFARQMGVADSW